MLDASSIFYLAIFTLTSALALGGYEYARVSKSLEKERAKRRS